MIIEHLLYTGYWYRMTLPLTSQKTVWPTGRLQLFSVHRDLPVRALSFQFHREDQFCLFRLFCYLVSGFQHVPSSSALHFITWPFSLVDVHLEAAVHKLLSSSLREITKQFLISPFLIGHTSKGNGLHFDCHSSFYP